MSPLFPLLALIARADAYGYELKRAIDTEFAPYWKIDFAQLYRSLAKLREQKLVRVRGIGRAGGPERKQYSLTPRGRDAVTRWLHEPATSREEFWVKARLMKNIAAATPMPLLIAGSDDPLLAHLAQSIHAQTNVLGSTAGLFTLAQQQADVVGAHLRDPETDEYNVSFVQHLVAEQDVLLVQFAVREYGLLVARGNPKAIRGVRDLARQGARLLNRPVGSGARLWLQQHVRAARVDPTTLQGWSNAATTYETIARALVAEQADAAPGLRATAEQFGLDFVPLGQEHFDLAVARELYESARGEKLFARLHTPELRAYARTLPGYDISHSGRVIAEIKYGAKKFSTRRIG